MRLGGEGQRRAVWLGRAPEAGAAESVSRQQVWPGSPGALELGCRASTEGDLRGQGRSRAGREGIREEVQGGRSEELDLGLPLLGMGPGQEQGAGKGV